MPIAIILSTLFTKNKTKNKQIKNTRRNLCLLSYKSEYHNRYKIAVIKGMIFRAKVISSSGILFSKELSNIKQTLINIFVTYET